MRVTRREWLSMMRGGAVRAPDGRERTRPSASRDRRRVRAARVFTGQAPTSIGSRRTGCATRSATAGLTPALEPFPVRRVDPIDACDCRPRSPHRRRAAVRRRVHRRGRRRRPSRRTSTATRRVGLTEAAPNTAAAGALGDARRAIRHKAIVCVTRGGRPGLCPSNADPFLKPFGPPVLQVSSEDAAFLDECARQGADVHVVAQVKRTAGRRRSTSWRRWPARIGSLPPLVVMTPRSGWWTCASERGGGIACWLELMRELKTGPLGARRRVRRVERPRARPPRHQRLRRSAARASSRRSAGWMHFGANIGAAQDPGNTIQASDDEFEKVQADAMTAAGLVIDAQESARHGSGRRSRSRPSRRRPLRVGDRPQRAVSQSCRSRTGGRSTRGRHRALREMSSSGSPASLASRAGDRRNAR